MGKNKTDALDVYVALLRSINIGGNRISMPDLTRLFTKAGGEKVTTYIQSGNVVFQAGKEVAGNLPGTVTKTIAKSFGFESPVVLRSAAEMKKVVAGNPFLKSGVDLKTLYVSFLKERPLPAHIAQLDPQRSPGDRFEVRGGEIYLQFNKGAGTTKLTNQYFDSKLKTVSTFRNWNTVLTLLEMTKSLK